MGIQDAVSRMRTIVAELERADWKEGLERRDAIIRDTRDLIDHGEPGVALENLCTNLYEFSVPITRSQYDEIAAIGTALSLHRKAWDYLVSSIE